MITLGIIGVVAALSIPSLINKINEIQTVSRVKKFYSTMNQTIKLAVEESGEDVLTWAEQASKSSGEVIGKEQLTNQGIVYGLN